MNVNKAAFLGRNGAIHTMPKNGLLNIFECRSLKGAIPALNILGQNGYVLSVVTNEKNEKIGGLNYYATVHKVENWIRNDVYSPIFFHYCYHHHAKKCACRLPKTGLIDAFVSKHDIDLSASIMFCTSKQEVETAEAAGIGTIIKVGTGKADWNQNGSVVYDSLHQAVLELSNG